MEAFEFDLDSVLEEPTQQRSDTPSNIPEDDSNMPSFDSLEFDEPLVQEEPKEIVPISPYNAEENADMLLGLIASVNILTLTPLARWKAKKKRGGKEAITKMQAIASKKYNGDKLTDEEKEQFTQYNAYLEDKKQLEKAIPYTDEELDTLKKAAVPYLKATQMKINGGLAFWVQLGTLQLGRVATVLTA